MSHFFCYPLREKQQIQSLTRLLSFPNKISRKKNFFNNNKYSKFTNDKSINYD
jgi:hypothetical protein